MRADIVRFEIVQCRELESHGEQECQNYDENINFQAVFIFKPRIWITWTRALTKKPYNKLLHDDRRKQIINGTQLQMAARNYDNICPKIINRFEIGKYSNG